MSFFSFFLCFFFFVTGKVESHVHGLGLSSGGVMYIWSSPLPMCSQLPILVIPDEMICLHYCESRWWL